MLNYNAEKPHVSYAAALSSAGATFPSRAAPPVFSPVEERLLIRFDGDVSPILSATYPEILCAANAQVLLGC
jgi:hypothetical protein